jgi:hypothetical protein
MIVDSGTRTAKYKRLAVLSVTALIACVTALTLGTANASAMVPDQFASGRWFSLVNINSSKCVDARGGSTANGTAIEQYRCNNTYAQQYMFQSVGGGWYRVINRNNPNQVWDVNGVSRAPFAPVQLWSSWNGPNQQWQPISVGNGYYEFRSRNSGQCLDVPYASTNNGVQLVQYPCNGSDIAERFLLISPGSQIGRGEVDSTSLGPLSVTVEIDHGLAQNIYQQDAGPAGSATNAINQLVKRIPVLDFLLQVPIQACLGNMSNILHQIGYQDAGYGVVLRVPYTAPVTCAALTSVWGQ